MTNDLKKSAIPNQTVLPTGKIGYNRFLLLVAGLGGLLCGVDVGIITGALPYLEATFKDAATGQALNAGQPSFIVAVFLPAVGKYGCGTMFFAFAGCTVACFLTATFLRPETKGKTLEEIEEHFEGGK